MVNDINGISGSGTPQRPDPAGFRAFTDRIMWLVAGLSQTLFPSADASLTKPDELLRGNPAEPDAKEPAAGLGGSTSVRTESSVEDKRELLRELRIEADGDDVNGINPRLSDLQDDEVVRLIEEAKYDEALDLIEDNRADKEAEAEDDGKTTDKGDDVSTAKAASDDKDVKADAEAAAGGADDKKTAPPDDPSDKS